MKSWEWTISGNWFSSKQHRGARAERRALEKEGFLPAPGDGAEDIHAWFAASWSGTKIMQRAGFPWRCGVQLSVTVAYSLCCSLPGTKQSLKEKKKKERALFPLLEDEGIFALIPKQTRLMPLNTHWHYQDVSLSCCCMQSAGWVSESWAPVITLHSQFAFSGGGEKKNPLLYHCSLGTGGKQWVDFREIVWKSLQANICN